MELNTQLIYSVASLETQTIRIPYVDGRQLVINFSNLNDLDLQKSAFNVMTPVATVQTTQWSTKPCGPSHYRCQEVIRKHRPGVWLEQAELTCDTYCQLWVHSTCMEPGELLSKWSDWPKNFLFWTERECRSKFAKITGEESQRKQLVWTHEDVDIRHYNRQKSS